jgi:hypothetical protein
VVECVQSQHQRIALCPVRDWCFLFLCLPPFLFCCDRNYLYMLRPKFGFFSCQLGLQMSSQFSLVDPHDVKAPTSPACLLLFFLSTNTCFYIEGNDILKAMTPSSFILFTCQTLTTH